MFCRFRTTVCLCLTPAKKMQTGTGWEMPVMMMQTVMAL